MQLTRIDITIEGTSPLLMHSVRLANPFDEWTKRLKALNSKRKKTGEDVHEIARVEWNGGLYIDDVGPYVPSEWIESMIRDGAKKNRLGRTVTSALLTETDRFHLDYDGPRDRGGVVGGRDVLRLSAGCGTAIEGDAISTPFRRVVVELFGAREPERVGA